MKAPPADAKKTASGLAYKVLKPGTGARHPKREQPGDGALHRLDDRREDVRQLGRCAASRRRFRSTASSRDGPKGVQLMVEGEKTRFWIPENLAYKGKSAPYGMLVFDVELLKIQ